MSLGVIFVIVGIVALLVPVVPTTPFLLLAGFLFDRSSPRFHHWLFHNRYFGNYLRSIRSRRGMTLRSKVFTLAVMWISLAVTLTLFVSNWWGRATMILISGAVTVYLLRVKTARG